MKSKTRMMTYGEVMEMLARRNCASKKEAAFAKRAGDLLDYAIHQMGNPNEYCEVLTALQMVGHAARGAAATGWDIKRRLKRGRRP